MLPAPATSNTASSATQGPPRRLSLEQAATKYPEFIKCSERCYNEVANLREACDRVSALQTLFRDSATSQDAGIPRNRWIREQLSTLSDRTGEVLSTLREQLEEAKDDLSRLMPALECLSADFDQTYFEKQDEVHRQKSQACSVFFSHFSSPNERKEHRCSLSAAPTVTEADKMLLRERILAMASTLLWTQADPNTALWWKLHHELGYGGRRKSEEEQDEKKREMRVLFDTVDGIAQEIASNGWQKGGEYGGVEGGKTAGA